MSGREHEPVAAFFPSIDRNLVRDLDRHLRTTKSPAEAEPMPAQTQQVALPQPQSSGQIPAPVSAQPQGAPGQRPNIASVLEAVENAAHSIAAMTSRIEELESQLENADAANRQLEAQLVETEHAYRDLESKFKDAYDRTQRAEIVAQHQIGRAAGLERELSAVRSDLARVAETITATLGAPHHPL